jgi:5-methylcytosine-specific restriction endonuclease McrA
MRDYMRNRYHNKRQALIKELGGKCKSCGAVKDLQIDHIDSSKKSFRAADVHSIADARVKEEIKNFQLLCGKCHKEKTNKAWDHSVPKPRHGTYWMRRRHGCRCDKCEKAYKEQIQKWRRAGKNEDGL